MSETNTEQKFRPFRGGFEWFMGKLVRGAYRLFIRTFYRVRVMGAENIPTDGPALFVSNHVSWMDGLFIAATQNRSIRPIVFAPITEKPFLRWFLKLSRAIPIRGSRPREVVAALREASDTLAKGGLVGIFAEGAITRTGFLLPFHRGFEQILKKSPAPIVPVCLHGVWGSIFSWQGGKLFWKFPRRLPYPVTVSFGKPLPPDTKAWQVRQTIQQMLADCFNRDKNRRKPAHRLFVKMAARHPFRACMIDALNNGRKLNYGQTLTASILMARRIKKKVGNARMIGLLLPTTMGGALANIAVALMGRTSVNLNYTASREAVLSAIKQCELNYVLTARAFVEKIKFEPPEGVEFVYLEDFQPTMGKLEKLSTYLGIVMLPGSVLESLLHLRSHRSDDLATIIFSSGSTGDPKGVILSHHNIVSNLESVQQAIDLLPKDVVLGVLPFFHSFGYTVTLWLPILVGSSIVYYPDPRQAKEIGEFVRNYGGTIVLSTPTFLRFLLRRCDKDDFKTVRLLITGAEKLPQSLAKEFKEKFGVEPLEGYGCTELSPVASVNLPDWESQGMKQIATRRGSIGQPIPGVAAKIVDRNTYEPLPIGEEGMLMIYGPNVMMGYLNRPEETLDAIRKGWYVTGDIAKIDEDGFITITDRQSRFSKIAGEMVPHQRVEEEIHKILGTNDRICAVTGLPDEKKGERLVVLHTELNGMKLADVQDRLRTGELPNLWLPGPKSFYQVEEIPVLGSGKLDLQGVKKLAQEMAGN